MKARFPLRLANLDNVIQRFSDIFGLIMIDNNMILMQNFNVF